MHYKLPEAPSEFMHVEGFDLADFPGKAEATGPYAKYLAVRRFRPLLVGSEGLNC